jgi:hypothetical protein
LRDAANHITELPKAEHSAPEWQAVMEALILVAETGGPTMQAGWRPRAYEGLRHHGRRDRPAGARVAVDCKTLPTKIRPQRGAWAGAVSEMRLLCRETN